MDPLREKLEEIQVVWTGPEPRGAQGTECGPDGDGGRARVVSRSVIDDGYIESDPPFGCYLTSCIR